MPSPLVGGGPSQTPGAVGPGALMTWVAEQVGLRLDGSRGRDLAVALGPLQVEIEARTGAPLSRALAIDTRLRERVIAAATITETRFMRSAEQVALLERQVLPGLIGARRGPRAGSLRVWSAGCASGEEAYSLAILLLEAVGAAERPAVEVLGTDVHAGALAAAARGRYRERRLDELSAERRARFFAPDGHGTLTAGAQLRRVVRFQHHNLLSAPPAGPFDLIVCRNLLIYLRPEIVSGVLERFASVLSRDGVLLLGEADQPALHSQRWRTVRLGGATCYRPSSEGMKP